MYYSLLGRDIEHEIVPLAGDSGLGILVWSPLSSGFLTGKYTRKKPAPEDARRNQFQFPQSIDLELTSEEVEELEKLTEITPLYPGWMQAMGMDPVIAKALEA